MVKIRLKRLGYKKNPFYRVVVINSREKRQGKPIQELGYYDPKKKQMKLDKEAALDWIKKGAQPSERVQYLIDNCDETGNLIVKEKPTKAEKKKAKAEAEAAKQATEAPVEEAVEETAEEATA